MLPEAALAFLSALFTGLLAGEEFVIRYGVRAPLAALDAQPSIQLRQALIRRLRILVPTLFGLAGITGVAATVAGTGGHAFFARCAGLTCLFVFITVTMTGGRSQSIERPFLGRPHLRRTVGGRPFGAGNSSTTSGRGRRSVRSRSSSRPSD